MNYKNIYDKLIKVARVRNEGDDNPENLVTLTFKEHFLAHQLLAKAYPYNESLIMAAYMMRFRGNYSRSFVKYKFTFSQVASKLVSDGWAKKHGFDDYKDQCEKIIQLYFSGVGSVQIAEHYQIAQSNVQRSIKNAAEMFSLQDELKAYRIKLRSELSIKIRNSFTPEQENKRVSAVRNADMTIRNKRLSENRKGAGNPMFGKNRISEIISCPHCDKTGAASQMKRWHFDKCKEKGTYEN